MTIRSAILGRVMTKGATGLVAAALTMGGGGAVVAAAATGSANPMNWGQQVVQHVIGCKAEFGDADHSKSDAFTDAHPASGPRANVGQCVSAFAQGHGAQQRASHSEAAESGSRPTPTPTGHGQSSASHGPSGASHGQGSDASQDKGAHTPPTPGRVAPSPRG